MSKMGTSKKKGLLHQKAKDAFQCSRFFAFCVSSFNITRFFSQKKQRKKTSSDLIRKSESGQEQVSNWSRFLRWCENSNNLGYLQGILFLNTLLIYGLNYWFKSQYGYDPMTFLSARYLDVNIPDLNNNNLNQEEE